MNFPIFIFLESEDKYYNNNFQRHNIILSSETRTKNNNFHMFEDEEEFQTFPMPVYED